MATDRHGGVPWTHGLLPAHLRGPHSTCGRWPAKESTPSTHDARASHSCRIQKWRPESDNARDGTCVWPCRPHAPIHTAIAAAAAAIVQGRGQAVGPFGGPQGLPGAPRGHPGTPPTTSTAPNSNTHGSSTGRGEQAPDPHEIPSAGGAWSDTVPMGFSTVTAFFSRWAMTMVV